MDWCKRKYYCASFDWKAKAMRIKILKNIDGVKLHPYKDVPKQSDETRERGFYQCLISVPVGNFEAVEYELRKAQRNDEWCNFKEIIRN